MNIINSLKKYFHIPQKISARQELIESVRRGLEDGSLHIRAIHGIVIDRNVRPSGYDDPRLLELYWSMRKGHEPEPELVEIIKQVDKKFWKEIKEQAQNPREKYSPNLGKPAIRLIKTLNPHISKLGGKPNLPSSFAWPLNPDGVELDFLVQLHCSELPAGLGLPATGTIFVFYDYTDMPWEKNERSKLYWKITPVLTIFKMA